MSSHHSGLLKKNTKKCQRFEETMPSYNHFENHNMKCMDFTKYGELDPTPYTAPFYLVFFGMMAADLGYGALPGWGTFIMLKFFHFDKRNESQLAVLPTYSSYPVMIWGIVFGSAFGAGFTHSSHYHFPKKTSLRL